MSALPDAPRRPAPPAGLDALTPEDLADKRKLDALMIQQFPGYCGFPRSCEEYVRRRLYRDEYATVDEYLLDKWGMTRSKFCRDIEYESKKLELMPPDGSPPTLPMPTAALQTRPLAGLDPETSREVWGRAVERCGGKVPTASVVKAVVCVVAPDAPGAKAALGGGDRPSRPLDDVEAARRAGIIPEGVEVEVFAGEPGDDEAPPLPIGNEAWLESLPARAKLAGFRRDLFDAEALAYRSLSDARDRYRLECRKVTNPLKAETKGRIGPWLARHFLHFRMNAPERWVACEDCGGQGRHPIGVGDCPTCDGAGYHL